MISSLIYILGIVLVTVFCINFTGMYLEAIERVQNGTHRKDDFSFVFSFLFGIIGYLLIKLFS